MNLAAPLASLDEVPLEDLARVAHLELACAPFAELLTRATFALRLALAGAGLLVGEVGVRPASLAAGLPGVVVRRAVGEVSAKADATMERFQVTALVVADLRQTGDTAFSVSLKFEARCLNELMFLKCAPAVVRLNPELRYRHNAGHCSRAAGGSRRGTSRPTCSSAWQANFVSS